MGWRIPAVLRFEGPKSMLAAEGGSASVELGVPTEDDGAAVAWTPGFGLAGKDLGETAGEDAAETGANGVEVMYDLS